MTKKLRNWAADHPRAVVSICSLMLSSAVFLATPRARIMTTATDYEFQVQNVIAGRGLTDPNGSLLTRTPPLYPLTLAALREASTALHVRESSVLFAFAALSIAAAAVCAYNLASLVAGTRYAVFSGILFALHPHVLIGITMPLSETPFLAALYGGTWLFIDTAIRRPPNAATRMFLAGALNGVAVLIRPTGLLVPIILALGVWLFRGTSRQMRLQSAAFLLAGVTLVLMPWEMYVWRESRKLILVSSNGVGTFRDGFAFHKQRRNPIWIPAAADRVVQYVWSRYDSIHDSSTLARLIASQAYANPAGVVQLYGFKALRSWYGVDTQQSAKELANLLVSALYMIPAAFGMARFFWRGGGTEKKATERTGAERAAGALLVVLILYFWAITTLSVSIVRYMVPTVGFACAFVPLCLSGAHVSCITGPRPARSALGPPEYIRGY